jgi:hypothetical protein
MIIAAWVWSGFAFVLAQGRPEALGKAKGFLLKTFIGTLIIFMISMFLTAVQGTIKKILPGTQIPTTQTQNQTNTQPDPNAYVNSYGTQDGRVPPAPGTYGAICTTKSGASGVIDSTGACAVGRGAGSNNSGSFCLYRTTATICTITTSGGDVPGTCRKGASGKNECVVAQPGDTCIDTAGKYGSFDTNYNCVFGTADGRTAPAKGQDGSSCEVNPGVYGIMAGGVCMMSRGGYVDPCPTLTGSNALHTSCTASNGHAGTCLLSLVTNRLVCQPKY